jgi:hypothetical protein
MKYILGEKANALLGNFSTPIQIDVVTSIYERYSDSP